jgi:hypothetical protein
VEVWSQSVAMLHHVALDHTRSYLHTSASNEYLNAAWHSRSASLVEHPEGLVGACWGLLEGWQN